MKIQEKFITVCRLRVPTEVQYYQAILEASGIECTVKNDYFIPRELLALGNINLRVRESDLRRAVEITANLYQHHPTAEA